MLEFFRISGAVFYAELSQTGRRGAGLYLGMGFFTLTALLFPFALGPYPDLLQRAGVGALWICAMFASLLTQEAIWVLDFEDGTFDILALSPQPLSGVVFGKMLAHWILSGVPLAVLAPLLGLFFSLPPEVLPGLSLCLLAGTFILSFAGGVAAILSLGARKSGVLLPLVLLPLYIPVLIFGVSGSLYFLLAAVSVTLSVCPLLGALCLRRALG